MISNTQSYALNCSINIWELLHVRNCSKYLEYKKSCWHSYHSKEDYDLVTKAHVTKYPVQVPWFIDSTCSWYKDGILSKLFSDGWLFRECWSVKVAGVVRFWRRRRNSPGRQRKGVLQTWSVNKANSRNQHSVSGNLSGSKGRRGGEGGWAVWTGADSNMCSLLSLSLQPCFSFLSNYCVSLSLIPV